MSNQAIFLLATPTMLIYLISAIWLNRQKKKYKFIPEEEINQNGNSPSAMDSDFASSPGMMSE